MSSAASAASSFGAVIEVADRVYAVLGADGTSNSGFVVGDEAVALVDTHASPRLGEELRAVVAGVTATPVRYAVLSHHHGDHIFGLQAWPEVTVLAHPACAGVLEQLVPAGGEGAALDPDEVLRVFVGAAAAGLLAHRPDHPINRRLAGPDYDDIRLRLPEPAPVPFDLYLGTAQLRLTAVGPAHGTDDLLVEVPSAGVAFLGDLGFVSRLPAVTSPHLAEWAAVTESIIAGPATTVVPGHGPVAPPAELAAQLGYLRALADAASGRIDRSALDSFAGLAGFERWNDLNLAVLQAGADG